MSLNKYRFCYDEYFPVDKKYAGVYAIKNNINGKMYIGETSNLGAVIEKYKDLLTCGECRIKELQKDWDEFGEHNFSYWLLENLTPPDPKEQPIDWDKFIAVLICRKHYYIEKHDAIKNGYNYCNNYNKIALSTDLMNGKLFRCEKDVKKMLKQYSFDKAEKLTINDIMEYIKKEPKKKTKKSTEDDE